jgi:hypothetical protein
MARSPCVPINSVSEFEAVLGQALVKIDKALYERGDPPKLQEVRRKLEKVQEVTRNTAELKKMRQAVNDVGEIVRLEISRDEQLHEAFWDLLDYIDFRT